MSTIPSATGPRLLSFQEAQRRAILPTTDTRDADQLRLATFAPTDLLAVDGLLGLGADNPADTTPPNVSPAEGPPFADGAVRGAVGAFSLRERFLAALRPEPTPLPTFAEILDINRRQDQLFEARSASRTELDVTVNEGLAQAPFTPPATTQEPLAHQTVDALLNDRSLPAPAPAPFADSRTFPTPTQLDRII